MSPKIHNFYSQFMEEDHIELMNDIAAEHGFVRYRVFHLKKLDSTLCLGVFLWYSEAVLGVKSSNRVGALTFRQENCIPAQFDDKEWVF